MRARNIGLTMLLAFLSIPLFVFVAHGVLELLSPEMKEFSASQQAACHAGACQAPGHSAKFWILEGTFALGTAALTVIPIAIAAALLRLNTWIVGAAIAIGITALLLYKNTWAFFAPLGVPGGAYIAGLASFLTVACGLLGTAITRKFMRSDSHEAII